MSEQTFKAVVGDRGRPIFGVLQTGEGKPVDLSASTVTFTMKLASDGTSKVAAAAATVHPTQTFTAATDDVITANDHKCEEGDQVIVSTTTTLPTGLAASTRYFVRDRGPNTFKLAATHGGAPVDITGVGSGTHSFYIVGSVQYAWASADVNAAGVYSGHWQETITASGLIRSYPCGSDGIHRGFPVQFDTL